MRTGTILKMIHNVLLNGKINTLFVVEDSESDYVVNPLFEALTQQAERIELLEQQNSSLIKQEEILLNILELSTKASGETTFSEKQSENIPYLESVNEDID
ncbi:MAG: hypothetical protein JEY91_10350 [Spirochaetaceae bacterium]|nr:hypothetical protein [Spirochaetaceae bacterium]